MLGLVVRSHPVSHHMPVEPEQMRPQRRFDREVEAPAAAAPSSAVRSAAAIGFATRCGRAALDLQHLLVRHTERLGEHGAQALVPRDQVAERQFQCRHRDRP